MNSSRYDIAIIGGGIVGMATAMAILKKDPNRSLAVFEAEDRLAAHQTGNNSGVIHSGLYYKPGSLKAINCVRGREALYAFCAEHDIPFERCGKIVVATREDQVTALDELERRAAANGLSGCRRLGPDEIREHEPHVRGVAGLFVPETGIVDFVRVVGAYKTVVEENGGQVHTSARVNGVIKEPGALVLETSKGSFRCGFLVNCAGLYSDRVAGMCGCRPGVGIVPFRGEYYELVPSRASLVKNLVYPVPDPKFPFLGVHFTRMKRGGVEAGPNAVLAFKREGYTRFSFSFRDSLEIAIFPGFRRMAGKYWRTGLREFYRSFCKKAFVASLQELIPGIRMEDVKRGGAGVRAQAVEESGALVDDFRIMTGERMVHVLNAPSPAATASINIGKEIADRVLQAFP